MYNGYQGCFPGIKQQVCGIGHPPPLALSLKMGRAILLLPSVLALAYYRVTFTFINIEPMCNKTFLQLVDMVRCDTLASMGFHS